MGQVKTIVTKADGTKWSIGASSGELDDIKATWAHVKTYLRFNQQGEPEMDLKVSHDQKKWVFYKTLKAELCPAAS